MAILSKDEILTNINTELADNNAGAISAYDVRHNLVDIVDSINQIVASGDFNATNPFTAANVRAKITGGNYGLFIAESGINFPNGGGTQYSPYPGPQGISHNNLSNLTVGDPHTQYLPVNGSRTMQNNLGTSSNWVNSSGNSSGSSNNRGIKFEYISDTSEKIHIGSGSTLFFDKDGSYYNTGKGAAKAWVNFIGSGNFAGDPLVNGWYNISGIEKLDIGQFKLYFTSGTFGANNYVALGNSNSRTSANDGTDFEVNTVGMVLRQGDDAAALRTLTVYVLNMAGEYVDADLIDVVVYGYSPGETSGVAPTVL